MLSIKSTPEAVSLASLFQMPLGGRVTCDSCVRVLLASLWSWACAKNWLNCYSEHMKQRGGMEAGEEWRQRRSENKPLVQVCKACAKKSITPQQLGLLQKSLSEGSMCLALLVLSQFKLEEGRLR